MGYRRRAEFHWVARSRTGVEGVMILESSWARCPESERPREYGPGDTAQPYHRDLGIERTVGIAQAENVGEFKWNLAGKQHLSRGAKLDHHALAEIRRLARHKGARQMNRDAHLSSLRKKRAKLATEAALEAKCPVAVADCANVRFLPRSLQ